MSEETTETTDATVSVECEDCDWGETLGVEDLSQLRYLTLAAESLLQEHRLLHHGE